MTWRQSLIPQKGENPSQKNQVLTKEPKSVWAERANLSGAEPFSGGTLIHLEWHPLDSSIRCLLARAPLGKPNLSLNTSIMRAIICSDFTMNGLIVDSIRVLTVEGYSRWTFEGHARASFLETLMNSVQSLLPSRSMTFAPAFLYLRRIFRWLPSL